MSEASIINNKHGNQKLLSDADVLGGVGWKVISQRAYRLRDRGFRDPNKYSVAQCLTIPNRVQDLLKLSWTTREWTRCTTEPS